MNKIRRTWFPNPYAAAFALMALFFFTKGLLNSDALYSVAALAMGSAWRTECIEHDLTEHINTHRKDIDA